MKVHTLAGARRPSAPALAIPTEPEYRWTFTTSVKKTYWEHEGDRYYSGKRQRSTISEEATMTVIAPTEATAKRKLEAALPSLPPRTTSTYGPTEYERLWQLTGTVEEVR